VGGTQAWLGPADATSAARILTASPYLFGEALGFGGAAPTAWFLHGVTPSFASWSGQIGIAALGSTGTPALWSAAGPHDFNGGAQTSAVASPDGTRLAFFGTWNSSSGVGRLDLGTAGQSPAQTLASQAIFSTRWEYELEPVAGGQAFLYATAPDQDNYWDIYRYLWSSGQSALISAQNQWWIELPGARVFYDEPDNSGLYRLRVADLRVLDPSRVADDEVRAVEDDQGRFYRFGAWVAYQVEAGVTARDGVYVWHAP
jgi:hypothetical protein